jgi:ubiquinone/menaquinone biosynthesis C-methylase UbiE
MPDIYTRVTEAAPKILESLMTALELRAADPQQRAMLHTYLTDMALPQGARVLEVGCGTGAVTRVLATWPAVGETIGVDPSPVFVAKARELAEALSTLTFQEADGRSLPFADDAFDAVVFHTIGTDMAAALRAEARRRVASGEYFGHIAYMSLVARKPT